MHIFQLMLRTYLYVAHSTILSEPLRNNPLSPPEELKKENKNLKYLDIWILQTSKMQWSLPPLSTL